MKGFGRTNQLFSLCGLNCGLCSMFLGKHCGGCGNGNQSCPIAKCSLQNGKIEYCYECIHYPCEKYSHIDENDSFITHLHQKRDIRKAKKIGIEKYIAELIEKGNILEQLLSAYNNGRKKNFYCLAVNLLELSELQETLKKVETDITLSDLSKKDKISYIVKTFQDIADRKGIVLKLRKK